VIAQNLGTALFSVPSGWAADRFGNRRVLNLLMLALCVAPMLSLFLSRSQTVHSYWFNVVFVLLGLTPVAIRTLNNYTLEISAPEDRPRYLSTLGLCIAAPPVLMSALMGQLVDAISFEFVFFIGTACLFAGWILTFRLIEPRHHQNVPS
jgi:MFS family permease